ncbi:hypothetical protein [Sharpea azabuensis]|uniref:hypothetical protein n=1 Tax=Sharpea azabuensis TaxID=322505 RepID=UPI00240953C5|nr:hypothetical protein [Sharpea azabuensis]MDD6512234.1 hypothetical protein [Sharpea azabuensis]
MKIMEITLKEGFHEKKVQFSESVNIIYSKNNSTGKTTFLRAILYALGYSVPSTRGIKFDNMEFWLTIENREKIYKLYRHGSYLSIDYDNKQMDYSLPSDFHEILTEITGCRNMNILDNLLGAAYMDQEKGWTLLNRGKVIGNISFNIEELVRGLDGKDCTKENQQLEAIEKQIRKYKYMNLVADYQKELYENGVCIEFDAPEEVRDIKLDTLRVEKDVLLEELSQLKDILRKNKLLVEYISDLKLTVVSSRGEQIPVTKETLVDFTDNTELLVTRKEMLQKRLTGINRKISSLEERKEKENQMVQVQEAIDAFDSNIRKIKVDPIETQKILDYLKSKRKELRDHIRTLTKQDNDVVIELHRCISRYAQELGISEKYVSLDKDYIFTSDLKSLSGTILHKIVFSFKLAYIKLIKDKAGIVLPIILDSPSGREVEFNTVEMMLKIIQRDYPEHQLIIASIYNYDLRYKKVIEFKDRMLDDTDIMMNS